MKPFEKTAFLLVAGALAMGPARTASAQLEVGVITVARVNVSSTVGSNTITDTLPAPRIVTSGMNVRAYHSRFDNAQSRSRLVAWSNGFRWEFTNTVNSSGGNRGSASGGLLLRARWTGSGVLVARLRATIDIGSNLDVSLVDVRNDGTTEAAAALLAGPPTYEEVVQIGPGPLEVRVYSNETHGNPGGLLPRPSDYERITIELEPIQVVDVGISCGPRLRGVVRGGGSHGLLDLFVTGSPQGRWAFIYAGRDPYSYRIPPTGCELYLYPTQYTPVSVSPAGTAELRGIALPPVLGAGAYFQYLVEDGSTPGTDWYTSQAVHVTAF